jgi:hypothetical protein
MEPIPEPGTSPEQADSTIDADATEEAEEGPQDAATEGADSAPPQPFHSVRAEQPGPRGCWALNARGGAVWSGTQR